jgi:hypothetical protein
MKTDHSGRYMQRMIGYLGAMVCLIVGTASVAQDPKAYRVRHLDPEKEKALRSGGSYSKDHFNRQRRGGKNEESNKPAPPEPDKNQTAQVNNNIPILPGIVELEYDIRALKGQLKEAKENLDLASELVEELSAENTQHKNRISELERSPGTPFRGWVWGQELEWVYSSPLIAPYYYSQDQGWFFYELGSTPRIIYKFKTKEWTTLNEK